MLPNKDLQLNIGKIESTIKSFNNLDVVGPTPLPGPQTGFRYFVSVKGNQKSTAILIFYCQKDLVSIAVQGEDQYMGQQVADQIKVLAQELPALF